MINLVSLKELNQIILGNSRAWVYSAFPRLPSGYFERPNFNLTALKWTGKAGCILIILIEVDIIRGQAELCFFDFIGKTTSSEVEDFCTFFSNSYSIGQIRTTVPENDQYYNLLIAAGFEHIATMEDHICISLNKYTNAIALNFTIK